MSDRALRASLGIAAVTLAIGVAAGAVSAGSAPDARGAPGVPSLAWKACGQREQKGFQCASAPAPLDYADPTGTRIRLAVIRHVAADPAHRIGTLFFNPGGPGGAGTEDLPSWLRLFPAALRARFDIVSWDPRGIGASTAVQCFASSRREARFLGRAAAAFPVGAAQERAWARTYRGYGRRCARRNGALLRHVSTADTARDLDLLRAATGDPQMSYLGVSYGTLLGATYANLFPGRVRALVLDGNVDPVAWSRHGSPLSTSLRLRSDVASSRTARALFARCGRVGRARCAFTAGTARATRAKFAALVRRIATHPQRFAGRLVDLPALIQSVNNSLASVAARPGGFPGWPRLAQILQALWVRANPKPPPSPPERGRRYSGPEQMSAVECGESPNPRRARAYPALARRSLRRAGVVGIPWPWGDSPCASWPARATGRYAGPWNRPTANPILVVNNTGDPQTPYIGGVRMARVLARARLLTVRGFGHTELLNPSHCAARHEVAYLLSGILPPPGTVCRADQRPFH